MKCVIFVNSLLGLITAVQIREYIYRDCEFDIILSDMVSELKNIFDNRILEEKFSNVKFIKYKNQKKIDKLLFYVSPKLYMKKLLGDSFQLYTDILFWNPTLLFHSCIMYLDKKKHHYNLHLYGDALGSYVTDYPFDNEHFKFRILNRLLRLVNGFKYVKDLNYDYYVFASEYISFRSKHRIIEIPTVKEEIVSYYNRLFTYHKKTKINNCIIFMDKQHDDQFKKDDHALKIIQEIIKVMGNEEVVVKPHPRQDIRIYSNDNINILNMKIPWELYCFNNDISDKVIISYGSTALFMPFIFNSKQKYTLINVKTKSKFEEIFENEYGMFIKKFKLKNSNFYDLENIDQLIEILDKIFDGRRILK